MTMALEVAKLSNCVSHQVGCVIAKDSRVVSIGYNGTPQGFKNCDEVFGIEKLGEEIIVDGVLTKIKNNLKIIHPQYEGCDLQYIFNLAEEKGVNFAHDVFASTYEIHAEMNAILFAVKNGISLDGTVMYVTLKPCDQCIKNIAQSGLKKVFYYKEHYRTTKDNAILKRGIVELIPYQEIN